MKFGLIITEDIAIRGGEAGVAVDVIGAFQRENSDEDQWTPIHAVTGVLPTFDELATYDGLCITGSHHSVNQDSDWIRNLEVRLRELREHLESHDRPRIFGICFGHQLLAKSFGGCVGRMTNARFIWGSERVDLTGDITKQSYFTRNFPMDRTYFKIMQSHEECVMSVPTGGLVAGSSASCENEVIKYGPKILSFQGHPEVYIDYMKERAMPRIVQKGVLTDDQLAEAMKTLDTADCLSLIKLVVTFLRGN